MAQVQKLFVIDPKRSDHIRELFEGDDGLTTVSENHGLSKMVKLSNAKIALIVKALLLHVVGLKLMSNNSFHKFCNIIVTTGFVGRSGVLF